MITTKIKDINSTRKKINITIAREKIQDYRTKACQKVSQTAKVNGFRPGKVPNHILERFYGPQIDFECLNTMVSDTYLKALTEHKLTPMTEPKFDTEPLEPNKDYSFSIELEIRPQFELKNYKGIKLKKKEAQVNDDDVVAELKRLQESLAQLAPTEDGTVLTKGLVATIDFTGKIDGKVFKGGQAKDYVFEYGLGQLLSDFEKNIDGMKKNETKTFVMDFPKDYFEKDLAGKKADYEVTLKNLHIKNLPPLDDELAKDVGKENLEQVKTELKDSLIKRKERDFRREYAEEIKKHLQKEYQFDVPESLVAEETERTKQDKKEIQERFRLDLVLDTIAHAENIQATQQDIEFRMITLAHVYKQPVEEIRKLYKQNNMMSSLAIQIVFDKTLERLIDLAQFS
ncbi:MAG TPA: trigger factor [bacterium]|nr:trigger factor [bacterium]